MLTNIKKIIRKRSGLLITSGIITAAILSFYAGTFFQSASPTPPPPNPRLQSLQAVPALPVPIHVKKRVKRGDTIINLLKNEGLDHATAFQFFMEIKPVYNLKNISAGKTFQLTLSADKSRVEKFIYHIDLDQYLETVALKNVTSVSNDTAATPQAPRFNSRIVTIPYQVKKEFIHADIQESLFAAILKTGEKAELADLMASLFEYDVDFNRDIRKDDSFAIMVEKMYLNDRFVRYGNIIAAEFTNQGNTIKLIRYTDPEGNTAYYHPDGRSVRKMFLRCPLPFMRVTSGYGNRRHPVLGFSARHYGTDFAAPIGTKVRATASGSVVSAGYDAQKGRFVIIQHNNRYATNYYHLSGIKKGIKRGIKVEQSQLIGYVGNTGLSTGAHLHYGMKKNGRFINPMRLNSPSQSPVSHKYMAAFKQHAASAFLLLSGSRLLETPAPLLPAMPGLF